MSEFIRKLNAIKSGSSDEWLTPSQERAAKQIRLALQANATVNLFGAAGTGKTFLAWRLSEQLKFPYFAGLAQFMESKVRNRGVIIDNCYSTRSAHRELLKSIGFRGILQAVLVSRRLVRDYTRYVELKLTSEDRERVLRNLTDIGLNVTVQDNESLWAIINPRSVG